MVNGRLSNTPESGSFAFEGYDLVQEIRRGIGHTIYHARNIHSLAPALIVRYADNPPAIAEMTSRVLRYTQTESPDQSYFPKIQHYRVMEGPGESELILVCELFSGVPLPESVRLNPPDIATALHMAIQLAAAVNEIHRRGFRLQMLHPDTLLWDPRTRSIKIHDMAAIINYRQPAGILQDGDTDSNQLLNICRYLAPEQTGRMRNTADHRSDFYSLGIVYYELLTGAPPFLFSDLRELIYAHLARRPVSLTEVDQRIPAVLSDIIIRLLAKNPAERYQSALGLQIDLEQCFTDWKKHGRVRPFALGRKDVPEVLVLPSRIYGRESELMTLGEAYCRAQKGSQVFVMITGCAGIGKTQLVCEFKKSVHQTNGLFITGKYEQYRSDRPYAAIIQAFQEMIAIILRQGSRDIEIWKDIFQKALKGNGRIIAEMVPEIALIIGPQPAVPDLLPDVARNRFHQVFLNFIKSVARKDRPLVLFLDDLQWADSDGLKLISRLAGEDIAHFFLLGAYRDNEVTETHPLAVQLNGVRLSTPSFQSISLGPLQEEHIGLFISDFLHREKDQALSAFARLLLAKTSGNPFFLCQFITSITAEDFLTYNYQNGRWEWDFNKIEAKPVTDNVIDLVLDRIRLLPPESLEILQVAACIGTRFDTAFLAFLSEKNHADIARQLQEVEAHGFIKATADLPPMAVASTEEGLEKGGPETRTLEFVHDRILQAVYGLIPSVRRKTLHLVIGRALIRSVKTDPDEEPIFDIANHLNSAQELLNDAREKTQLAGLNLKAGQKAKTSAAFIPALTYLQSGIGLLPKGGWITEYELALNLHVEAVEAAFLCGDYRTMADLSDQVLKHAHNLLDQMRIHQTGILAYTAGNEPLSAVKKALAVLKLLDIRLPRRFKKLHTLIRLLKIRWRLAGKKVEDIRNSPEMTDPHKLVAMRVLILLSSASFISMPELYPLVVLQQVDFSLRYGNAPESAFAYAVYGLILCGLPAAVADIETGYRYGRLALQLLENPKAEGQLCNTIFIFNGFIRHWKEHLRTTLEPIYTGWEIGFQIGNLETAAFCLFIHDYHAYCIGKELHGLEKEMRKNHAAIKKIRHQTTLSYHAITWQTVLNLLTASNDSCRLNGEAYAEEEMLPRHIQAKDRIVLGNLFLSKACLHYLFHQFPEALTRMEAMLVYQDALAATVGIVLACFYDSLIRLAVYGRSAIREKKAIIKRVGSNQKKLKKWARSSPANNQHKFHLVEAERFRVTGRISPAMKCYDKAIALSAKNGFVQEEALSNELAGRFFLSLNKPKIARIYLQDARNGYERWGARAKTAHLEEKYADLLKPAAEKKGDSRSDWIDFPAALHASQAISKEIVMTELLKKFLKILMETAGADRILFLSIENNMLYLKAEADVEKNMIMVDQPRPIHDEEEFLLLPVVNYVRRAAQPLLIDDTLEEKEKASSYFLKYAPRSILCLPVIRQTELTAILYMENNITAGAFSAGRIEILQVLAAQAAISMENARLYDNLLQLEAQLSYRLEIERVIASISSSFIKLAPDEIHRGIDQSLETLGKFVNEDRCYVFRISKDRKTISETNIWHAPHVTPRTAQLQRIPLDSFPWLKSKLERFEIIHVPRLTDLPPSVGAFRKFLENLDVLSFVWVPLAHGNQLLGFMGFDAVHQTKIWDRDYIRLLRTVSEILANACAGQRTAEALCVYQDQLRSLSSELILAEERERRRIAVGLHDGIGHALANTMNKLGTLREAVSAHGLSDTLREIHELMDQSIQNTRSLTFELSPHILYDIGLEAAVDWLVEKTEKEHGISIAFEDDLQPKPLDDTSRILIYQVIRELLFNVLKHAKAKHARVAIRRLNDFLNIAIEDDGIGFTMTEENPDSPETRGFGLFSIRERVRALGGTIEIQSKPGKGTQVVLELPLKKKGDQ